MGEQESQHQKHTPRKAEEEKEACTLDGEDLAREGLAYGSSGWEGASLVHSIGVKNLL
jgi:hypothetical protein